MFTGIIQEIGKIENIQVLNQKKYLTISCKSLQHDLEIGESIACNGICLTVISFNDKSITVEVMNQTLKSTTASYWKNNSSVHMEKAMSLSGRLNGHIVQGHIDVITALSRSFHENNTLYLEFYLPNGFQSLIVDHGSICIDGVSLTVARLTNDFFQVALIGHTISLTHFNHLKSGDKVNLEFDIIGKYIQKQLNANERKEKTITEEWLLNNGF